VGLGGWWLNCGGLARARARIGPTVVHTANSCRFTAIAVPRSMIWPFRRSETSPDASRRHDTVLDLIEQVAALRGHVRAIETEWDDVKAQVKKAYARIERANQRAEAREDYDPIEEPPDRSEPPEPSHGFAGKLQALQRMRQT